MSRFPDGDGDARVPRLHLDAVLAEGAELELDRARSHQLGDVLRLREGAVVALFDGRGAEHVARVVAAGKRVRLAVGPGVTGVADSPLSIALLQGVSRGDRMDATVRQAVELGVADIRPVMSHRASVRLDAARAARRHAHWQAIVVSACEQCGRVRLPTLHPVAALDAAIAAAVEATGGAALRLQFDPAADTGLGRALEDRARDGDAPRAAAVLVGPESGLDAGECASARDAGFASVRCGPRTLRTETAGPAAIAILQARFGDMDS